MNLLICLATAAVLAPAQKPDAPMTQLPKIEGIPAAAKMVPLTGHNLDAAKVSAMKFRPILLSAFKFDKDLRGEVMGRVGPARDQGDRPTGSVHAFTFLAEFVASKKGGPMGVNLSEEYLNRITNQICGNMQDGDQLFNLMRSYMTAGVCREALLTYKATYNPTIAITVPMRSDAMFWRKGIPVWVRPFGVGTVPPVNLPGSPPWPALAGHGANDAMLGQIKMHIGAGFPAAVTVRWPNAAAFATQDIAGVDLMKLPSVAQAPYSKGVAIVGYKNDARFPGGGLFIFRNSDGADWGDAGYGYMSYNYVRNLAIGILVLK